MMLPALLALLAPTWMHAEGLAWSRDLAQSRLCLERGDIAAAELWCRRALKESDDHHAPELERRLGEHALAKIYLAERKYRPAIGVLEPVAAFFRQGTDLDASARLGASLDLAEALAGAGRTKEAQTLLKELDSQAEGPNSVVSAARLGELELRLGRQNEAELWLRRAVKRAEGLWDGQSLWAEKAIARLYLFEKRGKMPQAGQTLAKAWEIYCRRSGLDPADAQGLKGYESALQGCDGQISGACL